MKLLYIIRNIAGEDELRTRARPYFNHSVEMKKPFSPMERAKVLESVGLNVFYFPSEMITGCDLLSDSGVSTMTNEQWAALHTGDEAYGSNRGFYLLMDQIKETFGKEFFNDSTTGRPNAFIFHQGRSCEDALFTILGKQGADLMIPSNGHFDTTGANIKANKIEALNFFCPELKDKESTSHFKGNMDIPRLKELLSKSHDRIPVVYITITNNTAAGQPVSLENIRVVAELCRKYKTPLFFDACRFAENAWFIKQYESGYDKKSIQEIVLEMFSYADGFTISFKKDGLVNMGGGLFLRDEGMFVSKYPEIPDALLNYQLIKEGHPTYGGLSGRDIMALNVGLKIITKEEYLTYRIEQVRDFGNTMDKLGIPVLLPTGGHAVYLDVNRFFAGTSIKPEDFGGVALTAVLLAAYGHRACELGHFAFGSYDQNTQKEKAPEVNFVRFAIPRLRYEKTDLDAVAEAVRALHQYRDQIPGVEVTSGRELSLRHFKARFRFKGV
ncbi:MAG: tryptophanase [bacterium]